MTSAPQKLKTQTILGYELTQHQDALLHYLIPAIVLCTLYIFILASDCGVIFRHYKDDNPIWASLTLSIMYFPALISFIITISSPELWPNITGYGLENLKWFLLKTVQHLFFPVWAMWHFAGKIFWAIEAYRNYNATMITEAFEYFQTPKNFELYFFFQAFLHSLPQMLLQINIIFRRDEDMHKDTADIQIASFVFNLAKLSATIAFYHRFKSQKLAGKQYPWFKPYKLPEPIGIDEVDSRMISPEPGPSTSLMERWEEPSQHADSPRSSIFYEEPSAPSNLKELKEVVGTLRETSVLDGPKRKLYREDPVADETDGIRRLISIKGLPEDDLAGKLVSFCWWSCFLLARILAVSAFAYFYPSATVWVLLSHVVFVIAFLIYDVKTDVKAKALFFLFLGLIYIFCIIEFKVKFKKTKFIYIGFFALVFVQNFSLCMVWWFKNVEEIENDFWFRYIFYTVIMCSIISVTSMMLYLSINKPQKVIVGQRVL